jgi:hypothetical protein
VDGVYYDDEHYLLRLDGPSRTGIAT